MVLCATTLALVGSTGWDVQVAVIENEIEEGGILRRDLDEHCRSEVQSAYF
jgi:hypothetical protein